MDASPSPPPENSSPHTTTTPTTTANALVTRFCNGKVFVLPPTYDPDRSLYRPHGKWAWADGHEILCNDRGFKLGYGLEGHVYLKLGQIDGKEVTYISKLCSVWHKWDLFLSSLYLNASSNYLRPLQGDIIPWIIGVTHCNGGQLGLAQDLPHPTGWREADAFLEEEQKEAIIAAYKKLHDRGVLHGDAQYRHWLIGDDRKVTLIDFGFARVTQLDAGARTVGVEVCSQESLSNEMRKVKYMLDYKDSRTMEHRLAQLRHEREQKDRANESPSVIENGRLRVMPRRPKESLSEEEKAAPFLGVRLKELEEWGGGDTWTAHRHQVVRVEGRVLVHKTPIPHPQITPTGDHDSPASSPPKPEAVAPVSQPGSTTSSQVAVAQTESPSVAPPADAVSSKPDARSPSDAVQATETPTPGPADRMSRLRASLKRAHENSQEDSSSETDDASTPPHGSADGGAQPGIGSPRSANLPPNKRRRCSAGSEPEAIKPSQPSSPSPQQCSVVKPEACANSVGEQDIPANADARPAGASSDSSSGTSAKVVGILKRARPEQQPPPPTDESTSLENRASSSRTDGSEDCKVGRAKGKGVKRSRDRPVKRLRFADKVTAIKPEQTKWASRSDRANPSSSSSDSEPEDELDAIVARIEQEFRQQSDRNTSKQGEACHPGILHRGATSEDVKRKAVEQWFRFDALRTQCIKLHRLLEQMRRDAETHRDGFMFGMLSIPAAERKPFLRSFGKQNKASILGYLGSTTAQPPAGPSRQSPNLVLRDARSRAVRMVAERDGNPRCPPESEIKRNSQIKVGRKGSSPRIPSKLSTASGSPKGEDNLPTDSSSSESDMPPGEVTPPNSPPRVETTLQKAERYTQAVMRRAEVELEREKRAGMGIARTVSYLQLDLGANQSRKASGVPPGTTGSMQPVPGPSRTTGALRLGGAPQRGAFPSDGTSADDGPSGSRDSSRQSRNSGASSSSGAVGRIRSLFSSISSSTRSSARKRKGEEIDDDGDDDKKSGGDGGASKKCRFV